MIWIAGGLKKRRKMLVKLYIYSVVFNCRFSDSQYVHLT